MNKRIIALFVVVMISLQMVACKKSTYEEYVIENHPKTKIELLSDETHDDENISYTAALEGIFIEGKYFDDCFQIEIRDSNNQLFVKSYDESQYVRFVDSIRNDNLIYLSGMLNDDFLICRYDVSTNEYKEIPLSIEMATGAIDIDRDGNLLIAAYKSIYIYDSNVEYVEQKNAKGEMILSIASTDDGNVYYTYFDEEKEKTYLTSYTTRINEEIEYYDNPIDIAFIYGISRGVSSNLILITNYGAYLYDVSSKEQECIINFEEAGFEYATLCSCDFDSKTLIMNAMYLPVRLDFGYEHGLFSVDFSDYQNSKDIITLAACGYVEFYGLEEIIQSFNRSSADAYIEVEDLSHSSSEELINHMNSDECPDVFIGNESDYLNFKNNGLLIDLKDYLKEYDFIDSLENTFYSSEEIYAITPFVSVVGLLTYEGTDMNSYAAYDHIIRHDTRDELMKFFMPFFINSNMDGFTEEEVSDFLSFCYENGKAPYNENVSVAYQLKNNELMGIDHSVGTFETFISLYQYFGKDVSLNNSALKANGFIGVCSNSAKQDLAKTFIDCMLSNNVQLNGYNSICLPTVQSCFDKTTQKTLEDSLEEDFTLNDTAVMLYSDIEIKELSQQMEQIISGSDSGHLYSEYEEIRPDGTVPLRELNINDVYLNYVKIINGADSFLLCDPELITIFEEESVAYFEGAKTLSEVSKIISGRANMLIEERK